MLAMQYATVATYLPKETRTSMHVGTAPICKIGAAKTEKSALKPGREITQRTDLYCDVLRNSDNNEHKLCQNQDNSSSMITSRPPVSCPRKNNLDTLSTKLHQNDIKLDTSSKPVYANTSYESYDQAAKIILLGDYSVGKSRFLRTLSRVKDEDSNGRCTEFRDGETAYVVFRMDNKRSLVKVMDTGGQERYRSLTWSYYRGANGCLLLFDVTREDTFSNIMNWYQDLSNFSSHQFVGAILVGITSNLQTRTVTLERCLKMAESLGIPYMECFLDNEETTSAIVQRLIETISKVGLRRTSFTIQIKPRLKGRTKSRDILETHQMCACT